LRYSDVVSKSIPKATVSTNGAKNSKQTLSSSNAVRHGNEGHKEGGSIGLNACT
jgi:hypothetical protein